MSVEFSNAYQEILLDNLMSVIKQNFVFQTQLKLTENVGKNKIELESKISSLINEIELLKIQSKDAETYKMKAEQNTSAHEEKSRIQTALNDTMKQLAATKKQLEEKQNLVDRLEIEKNREIVELKDYIKLLEENVPISKMKKINPSFKPTVTDFSNETNILKINSDKLETTTSSNKEKQDDGSSF